MSVISAESAASLKAVQVVKANKNVQKLFNEDLVNIESKVEDGSVAAAPTQKPKNIRSS